MALTNGSHCYILNTAHATIGICHAGRASNTNFLEQIISKNKSNFNRAGNKRVFFLQTTEIVNTLKCLMIHWTLIWKAESLRDLKYCSFWGAITCDLISYAFKKKKDVEAILRRRAKWLTKWTFTIGKKIHITVKVVNVIQRNMQWVLTVKIWGMESHLSSFCSLQPRRRFKTWFYCRIRWVSWSFLSIRQA